MLALLFLVLSAIPTPALKCFTCSSLSPGESGTCDANVADDTLAIFCPAGADAYCLTETTDSLGAVIHTRSCGASCVNGSVAGITTKCCSSDYCNGDESLLQCYSCSSGDEEACNSIKKTCSRSQQFCETVTVTTLGVTAYTKGCSSSCTETSPNSGRVVKWWNSCCQTSLCNFGSLAPKTEAPTKKPLLKCYSCVEDSRSGCTSIKENCLPSQTYCQTVKEASLAPSKYSKGCAASCTESSRNVGFWSTLSTFCCSTSLCNAEAAVRFSFPFLVAVVLTSIFA